jgi:murein L,D-transpeptidase YcbB/YkuD
MIIIPQSLQEIDAIITRTKPKNGQAMRLRNSFRDWYRNDLTWFEATQDRQQLKNGQDRLIAFVAANGGARPVSDVGADASSMPKLQLGSQGDAVKVWTKGIGMTPSDTFTNTVKDATKAWQKSHGLKADGVVGPMSWATINLNTATMVPAKIGAVVNKVMTALRSNAGVVAGGAAIGVGAAIVLSKK